jgi:hypothetical protein
MFSKIVLVVTFVLISRTAFALPNPPRSDLSFGTNQVREGPEDLVDLPKPTRSNSITAAWTTRPKKPHVAPTPLPEIEEDVPEDEGEEPEDDEEGSEDQNEDGTEEEEQEEEPEEEETPAQMEGPKQHRCNNGSTKKLCAEKVTSA